MNILFVSENDACRGPMARALAQMQARDMDVPHVGFDSAGLGVTSPQRPTADLVQFLREQQLNIARHLSKPLGAAPVRWADLILCMTKDLVARTRMRVGPSHAGKVLLLNDATRLGHTPAEKDIQSPAESTYQGVLTLFSRLKASTGRLVRLIEHGHVYPEDFGAEVDSVEASNVLDDPHVRHFLSRYVVEYVERAFEPPTSEDLLEALVVIGRPLTVVDLEELLRTDLDRYLFQDELGRWNVTPLGREEQARAKRERKEKSRRHEEQARRERAHSGAGAGSQPPPDSVHMTQKEALETLSIGLDTPRDQGLKRYRLLLMRFHPDKFHDDEQFRQMAEGKTKRINAAWALIKDRLPESNSSEPSG